MDTGEKTNLFDCGLSSAVQDSNMDSVIAGKAMSMFTLAMQRAQHKGASADCMHITTDTYVTVSSETVNNVSIRSSIEADRKKAFISFLNRNTADESKHVTTDSRYEDIIKAKENAAELMPDIEDTCFGYSIITYDMMYDFMKDRGMLLEEDDDEIVDQPYSYASVLCVGCAFKGLGDMFGCDPTEGKIISMEGSCYSIFLEKDCVETYCNDNLK